MLASGAAKLTFLSVVLAFALTAAAQSDFIPGYVVSLKGDTIRGYIDNRNSFNSNQKCDFRLDLNSKVATYLPGDVRGYGVANRHYVSSNEIGYDRDLFVEFLLSGRLSLYEYTQDSKEHFIVKKDTTLLDLLRVYDSVKRDNGSVTSIHEKRLYVGQLRALTIDAPQLSPELDDLPYKVKALVDISKQYHELTCAPGEECIEYYKKDTGTTELHLGFTIDATLDELQLQREFFRNYRSHIQWNKLIAVSGGGGILLDVKSHQWSQKLSFMFGAIYRRVRFDSEETYDDPDIPYGSIYHRLAISYDVLMFPASLRFTASSNQWKVQPFVEAGMIKSFLYNKKFYAKYALGSTTDAGEYDYYALAGGQLGFRVYGGVSLPIRKSRIDFGTGWTHANGIHDSRTNPSQASKKLSQVQSFGMNLAYFL